MKTEEINEDLSVAKRLAMLANFTAADKKKVRTLGKKYGIDVNACHCRNKFQDAAVRIYAKLRKPATLNDLPADARFEYKGIEAVATPWGVMDGSTCTAMIRTLYKRDRRLFNQLYRIL